MTTTESVQYKITYGRISEKERNTRMFDSEEAAQQFFTKQQKMNRWVDVYRVTTTITTEKITK